MKVSSLHDLLKADEGIITKFEKRFGKASMTHDLRDILLLLNGLMAIQLKTRI